MKIGTDWGSQPQLDVARVRAAREAIGANTELMVDANGTAPQAVAQAERFADSEVTYFGEPVCSDHLDVLAFVRHQVRMAVAAGEYSYDPWYFQAMLRAGSVDILQADVTRCLGVTGWLQAADLAYAANVPFSAHTAPSIHALLRSARTGARGLLPRPRAHRAHVLRRRAAAGRWLAASRSVTDSRW